MNSETVQYWLLKTRTQIDTRRMAQNIFPLPLKTRIDVIKLDAELEKNMELKQHIHAALSLLGGGEL
jgi:hypothetical protein